MTADLFTRVLSAILLLTVIGVVPDKAGAEAAPPTAPFEALDVFDLEYANDPQIAPSGDSVVYVRTSMDIMRDASLKQLWQIDLMTRAQRPLVATSTSASQPRWSTAGNRLSYVSAQDGRYHLYSRWLDTGATALLASLPYKPSHIVWSPDDEWLAFLMFVPAQREPLAQMPRAPEGAQWAAPARQIDSLIYRADGEGFLQAGRDHIFVVPADGGTPRQLTQGDYAHHGPLAWSADAKRLFFSSFYVDDWEYQPQESDIYSVALAAGSIEQWTERSGPDKAPVISPNGRYLAWLGHAKRLTGYNNMILHVRDLETGETRALTSTLDRSIDRALWTDDSHYLWVQYDDGGTGRLARVSLDGALVVTDLKVGGTTLGRPYSSGTFDVVGDGQLVYTVAKTDGPADLALSQSGASPLFLTRLNDDVLGHKALATVEPVVWPSSHDELAIEGWLMKPPGFDPTRQYPLILEIHGGPHAAYGPNFSAEAQLYASAGYLVLYANPRGSTSYGDAFANAIHLNYPGNDFDDLMSGVDAMINRGFVDTDNLFVTGGSGGGVLTAWIVGKTDRFRAAVVAKPVINWVSFALTADNALYFSTLWFDGPAWENTAEYWRRSPLSLVGNVSTPTLLLTGEADYRTPMSETEQYYQALKQRKIDTMMIRIPDAPHGIAAKPSRLIAKVTHILAWFERYRRDNPAP